MTIKSIISFLISCLSITALLAQSNVKTHFSAKNLPDGEVIITIEVGNVSQHRIAALGEAVKVKVNEGTPLLVAGAPDVEKLNASIQIPLTGKMAIEVLAADFVETEDVEVVPSKGNLSRKVNPSEVPFTYGEAYQTDAFYPGALAEVKHTFIMRDVRGQAMWFYPVQYNPVTKKLRTYTNMTIRVYRTAESGDNEILAPKQRAKSKSFYNLYKRTFINFADQTAVERSELGDPEKMLVICKDDFQEAIAPLLEWKKQMGIHTTVVPTSIAGSTAADVLAYVTTYYEAHDISYLLLVGAQEAIYPEFRGSYSCDNCFGYMSGDDHYPEIMVGRFNAETAEQVELMVMRNLEYEKSPVFGADASWCNTGLAAASNEGAGIGDDDQADFEHANEWKTKHLDATYAKYFEFYDGNHAAISPTPGDESADESGNPSTEDIVALMNGRGISLYNYTGHGWEQGLVSGNFSTTAVADLRNVHKYPFMIAVACCAGNFTNNSDGDCLGEAAQRAGDAAAGEAYGIIGGLFSSDFQSWSPPMEGQDMMNFMITKADSMQVRPTFGEILTYGNFHMIAAYDQDGEDMADYWNPFLEPTTVIRTDNPQSMVANIPAQAYLGQSEITITSAVEGALVGVYFQGQTLASGIIENGQAVINFPALANAGDLVVTISHFNFAPLQQIVPVVPLAGPFIVQQQLVLDDATTGGNNNAKADFGEMININLTLANIGLSQAHNVQTALAANDPYISIVDGTETWGNIEDSTDLAKTNVFTFEVADSIPNNHVVNFQLLVNYDDTTNLVINLPVTLQAPILEVVGFEINDASGNNNGRLDANETAVMQVTVKNTGKAVSPIALGTLLSNSTLVTVQAPISLGVIPSNGGVTTVNFGVTVSPTVPQNHPVIFDFKADALPYSATKVIALLINPIVEDFESGVFETFEWQMQGNKPWITSIETPFQGTTCSRSGDIANNQKSIMTLNLEILEAGQVSFARKVSSEENYDYLKFSIDGQVQDKWSGEEDWKVVNFPISIGMHTLSWTYEKDEFATGGQDGAWVDDIFLPLFEVEVATNEPIYTALQIRAIPNPTSGEIAIQYILDENQSVKIELYDLNGRMVQDVQPATTQLTGSYSHRLNLQGLSAGIYMVKVRTEKGSNTIKVVKI